MIVTIDTAAVDDVVRAVRARRPDVMIVARAHDAQHARHLYTLAVTDTVPETIEASLQLAESALVGLGVPMGLVIASIHERRELVRQRAAGRGRRHRVDDRRRSASARRDKAGQAVKVISWNLLRLTGRGRRGRGDAGATSRSPTCS